MARSLTYYFFAILLILSTITLVCWRLMTSSFAMSLLRPDGSKVNEDGLLMSWKPHKQQTKAQQTCGKGFNLRGYSEKDRNEDLIIYTEVPKCASTTFMQILSNACKNSKTYSTHYTMPQVIQDLLKVPSFSSKQKFVKIQVLPFTKQPYIFMGHLTFFDFNELGYKQPLFIDLVRDPVERWISLYYYTRADSYFRNWLKLTPDEIKQTLGDCLHLWIRQAGCMGRDAKDTATCLKARPFSGCKGGHIVSTYPEWFSGKYAHINSSMVSIERAKANIEKYYTFIGITEHFKETLVAMETILPRFKNELSEAYKSTERANVGHNKVRPNNSSIAVMRELLADDYDLYKFILQRFYIHLKCLGVHGII
ncbi:unnamed protein product [Owenia fusiformis]|uniref:Uncharacterized protein n=1 Tax=Owenia fusiformis TaxID=6347 RepID=A0A8J1UYG0_OWEFU|nr:unnamed protein product [Owenia fusiformis]